MGNVLYNYTSKNCHSYDPKFDQYIKQLRPDWFEDKVQIKKDQLIEIAKNGDQRPNKKHPLGEALVNYTNKKKGSYDPIFDRIIRALRPDWFRRES